MTIDLNGYALKNVKTLDTSDGYALTATLHKDGKKVGTVENGGYGGPTTVWWSSPEHGKAFEAWVATLGSYTYPPMLGMETPLTVPYDEEVVLGLLEEAYEDAKQIRQLDKKALTALLYREKTDEEGVYRVAKLPAALNPTDPATLKLVAAKAPWWGKVGEVWVIGKGWQPV